MEKYIVEIGQCNDWYVYRDNDDEGNPLTYDEANRIKKEAESKHPEYELHNTFLRITRV